MTAHAVTADLGDATVEVRGAVRLEAGARGTIPRRTTVDGWRRLVDAFHRASVGQSPGVRLAFRTAARRLVLRVSSMRQAETVDAEIPPSVYELSNGGRVVASALMVDGPRILVPQGSIGWEIVDGPDSTMEFALPEGEREYELWLPYTDEVELLDLVADAPVIPPSHGPAVRWIHHGSSISHGYVAGSTRRTWTAIAAERAGVELMNLSYSGNALLDVSTAQTIRDTPADLISVKLGVNVVNGDMMRRRIFASAVHGFLDTIRDGHPDTPLLVVSPIHCGPIENAPGPSVPEPGRDPIWVVTAGRPEELATGKLSLTLIRAELRGIVEARRGWGDAALHYLDGLALYGADDDERMPMPDNLHPGDDVNALIGERFADLALGRGGPLAPGLA